MAETIYFNGKKYNSVAEMPSSVRQKYESFNRLFADANRDGIPDFVQPSGISGLKESFNLLKEIGQMGTEGIDPNEVMIVRESDTNIFVNGKNYKSVDEMPSDVRQVYEKLTKASREGNNEIFDESWRAIQRDEFFEPHDDEILNRQIKPQPQSMNDPIEPIASTSRFLFLVVATILVLGIAGMVWLILF
jgi:hypothetical protein